MDNFAKVRRKEFLKSPSGSISICGAKKDLTIFRRLPKRSALLATISMVKYGKENFERDCTDVFFVFDYDTRVIGDKDRQNELFEWITGRILPVRYNLITRQITPMHNAALFYGNLLDSDTKVKTALITETFDFYCLLQAVDDFGPITLVTLSMPGGGIVRLDQYFAQPDSLELMASKQVFRNTDFLRIPMGHIRRMRELGIPKHLACRIYSAEGFRGSDKVIQSNITYKSDDVTQSKMARKSDEVTYSKMAWKACSLVVYGSCSVVLLDFLLFVGSEV